MVGSILELISQAIGLTDTVLRYIDKNRDFKLKEEVEDLITEIREEDNKLPEHRDDQKIVDLQDELMVKMKIFRAEINNARKEEKPL